MTDYHKQELIGFVDTMSDEQLDVYLNSLRDRLKDTQFWIRELTALKKRRKAKNSKVKETGIRSG